jgi:gamma-glutamylcyclotransferase (GGCT)/AIG2-like uncharacterized protein YtfP/heme-degrading monooxygenase HmoA
MTEASYVYVWEYEVRPEHVDEFLRAYGVDGDWVRLFRGHTGYAGTELLRDRADPLRFTTVDRWESARAWEAFRAAASAAFEELDARCEAYTASERELGRFEAGGPPEGVPAGAERRLVVYGSLQPGGSNHGELAGLAGTWHEGWITGELLAEGWGANLGYPAIRWSPGGARVPAHLLESEGLPEAWRRLDDFEGEEYLRVPVPFFTGEGTVLVGQVYAHRASTRGSPHG